MINFRFVAILDIDDCESDPCQNNAVCTNLLGPGYQCECQPGYNGTNCETGMLKSIEGSDNAML